MSDELVLHRSFGPIVGMLLVGAILTAIGVVLARAGTLPGVAVALFVGVGVPVLLSNTRLLLVRPPRLRATASGVWFGGGWLVPWTEIKAIYEASFDVSSRGARGKTAAIAFDFHKRQTLFRVPISLWLTSPFGVGDVDVSPGDWNGTTSALVANLDAIRARQEGAATR